MSAAGSPSSGEYGLPLAEICVNRLRGLSRHTAGSTRPAPRTPTACAVAHSRQNTALLPSRRAGSDAATRRRGACPHRILARACPTCGERHHRNLVRNRQHTAPRRTQRCTAATCTPSAGSRLRADIAEASARRVTPQALQPGSCSQSLFLKKCSNGEAPRELPSTTKKVLYCPQDGVLSRWAAPGTVLRAVSMIGVKLALCRL